MFILFYFVFILFYFVFILFYFVFILFYFVFIVLFCVYSVLFNPTVSNRTSLTAENNIILLKKVDEFMQCDFIQEGFPLQKD